MYPDDSGEKDSDEGRDHAHDSDDESDSEEGVHSGITIVPPPGEGGQAHDDDSDDESVSEDSGIATAPPDNATENWASDVGTLAIDAVKMQLAAHEKRQNTLLVNVYAGTDKVPSLFDLAALKVAQFIGNNPKEDMEAFAALPPSVLGRAADKLVNIPYLVICMARKSHAGEGDVDEWILRNEKWLRDTSQVPVDVRQSEPSAKKRRGEQGREITEDSVPADWTHGLIRLSSHAEIVFPDSDLTQTSRIITRPSSLPGFKVLDGNRSPVIRIQPSVNKFAETFNEMTGGLLKGLDWNNVFIAGGIALGTLLCTKDEEATNTPEQWKKSDVDLYIYGLGPVEANKKVQHIFDIFKANVPTGMPILAVRNSKTITFFSKYPLRRIQVVLKLVSSPKDVLLNFDLDICAVGWNGKEVWMLPRAARSLETGYTVFTMDLINGHYLGDRRATQEQRVFKYADKGYGIRILPSYLAELQTSENDTDARRSLHLDISSVVDKIALKARAWTARAIKYLVEESASRAPSADNNRPPIMSHARIQQKEQITEDPSRRSCMSGLGLFMRHVSLWERDHAGQIVIKNKDDWASQDYDDLYAKRFGVDYNDSPDYSWDEKFTIEEFIKQINTFNMREATRPRDNIWYVLEDGAPLWNPMEGYLIDGDVMSIQRMTYATSVDKILQPECDIIIPLWLPKKFVKYVDKLVPEKARESGIQGYSTSALVQPLKDDAAAMSSLKAGVPIPVLWRITSTMMWQQLHRAIDEVHEMLWSFHHANVQLDLGGEICEKKLVNQFRRRAIRKTAQDEYMAFARWVSRDPVPSIDWDSALSKADNESGDDDLG